jgi:hypothetical protein
MHNALQLRLEVRLKVHKAQNEPLYEALANHIPGFKASLESSQSKMPSPS